jgi:hypothetical protein
MEKGFTNNFSRIGKHHPKWLITVLKCNILPITFEYILPRFDLGCWLSFLTEPRFVNYVSKTHIFIYLHM